ncbi:hypothetical protein SH139x_003157 [Planctomycetaceae bacterium SH139]
MKIVRGITVTTAVLALLTFSFAAFMLIPQALRYSSEAAALPPRAQPGHYAIARASGIAGATAIVGVILSTISIIFTIRRRVVLPIVLLGISIIAMVAVAIIFKPA